MLKALYKRHQYFFNLLFVLFVVQIIRIWDWLAWTPPSPDKTKNILIEHLFEFISFLPIIILLIFSYQWAIKRNRIFLLYALIIIYAVFGPSLYLVLSTWLEIIFWRKDVLPVSFNLILKYSPGGSLIILFLSAVLLSYPSYSSVCQTKGTSS